MDAVRLATAEAHQRIEAQLGLPGAIQTASGYRWWLRRFLGIYQPLEAALARFEGWECWNIELSGRGHTAALRRDLAALGDDPELLVFAPAEMLPSLGSLAEAFGALYVLEGSKLGGQIILRDILGRLGYELQNAHSFFSGYGAETGRQWTTFKDSLERYCADPSHLAGVIAGANATFTAVGAWMSLFDPKEVA